MASAWRFMGSARAGARLALGLVAAAALSLALALAIGLFSLRVQSIFFAMVTLAVAYAFNVLASQLSWLTGGEDGRSFKVPDVLQPGFRLVEGKVFGVAINGKILTYYLVLVVVAAAFLVLLRVVNSPFGRVLQAIRENPFRAEALGYRTVFHRTLATCISALGATLAGALSALWLRYVGPDTALSFSIQVDVLVMVVVGGMGSLYGAILGAALFVFAESYLQDAMGALSQARRRREPAAPAGALSSRPLAAVARPRLRARGLFRPDRHRRRAQGKRGEGELTHGRGRGTGRPCARAGRAIASSSGEFRTGERG